MSLLDILDRHLPWPVFLFRGGPVDGKRLPVEMVRNGEEGFWPPTFWKVENPARPLAREVSTLPCYAVVRVHTYRFVSHGRVNSGHYEYCEDK